MKVVGIIPARHGSTRFPGKPLAAIAGRSMIARVVDQARQAKRLSSVLVATDDQRIADEAEGAGATPIMTPSELPSGTDRVAWAARDLDCHAVLNIQGDEPLLPPDNIDRLAAHLVDHPEVEMGTLMAPLTDQTEIDDPNVVKVVTDRQGRALYFSRSPLPFRRGEVDLPTYRHIGLYGFRHDFLQTFTTLEPAPLEAAESLEQLRALWHGHRIDVVECPSGSPAVDTPEDVRRIEEILARRSEEPRPTDLDR